ncbi:MAG: LysR family transcriptional regulator [Rubrivivax sp.]|nr:LysR family transcriptional regulator [Rubrivivax sp.]
MHITHSAVSQQIKLLEEQLGLPLFDRRGRSLALNAAGAALQAAVERALDRLAQGLLAAQAAHRGAAQQLRLTVLPSFAQRWLLPRLVRFSERHPDIVLNIHASQQLVDLQRDGVHVALRGGFGPWRGLQAEPLMDSPLIAVAAPARAARLPLGDHRALAAQPLLGSNEDRARLLALCGCALSGKTVADFNDGGLMLQAAEQDTGIALAHELLAADALQRGQLVRVSPLALHDSAAASYWFVHPPELADWPPLMALRQWLFDEVALSRQALLPG